MRRGRKNEEEKEYPNINELVFFFFLMEIPIDLEIPVHGSSCSANIIWNFI